MSVFQLFFQLGISHITDLQGFDHILFLICLCAVYSIAEWKKVLILITAFTLGHTLTLALATLSIVSVSSQLVEFLIPVTIFITSLTNFFQTEKNVKPFIHLMKYSIASIFGMIHGLGFSNYLRAMLTNSSELILSLFAFNLGVEIGQIMILIMILFVYIVVIKLFKLDFNYWNRILSGIGVIVSLFLIFKRWPL
jgi:hypothetical protein